MFELRNNAAVANIILSVNVAMDACAECVLATGKCTRERIYNPLPECGSSELRLKHLQGHECESKGR